ncbi:hypothetical protein [Enhygromyxa salina]|uniref:Uncharacterized protein n=1 Tax=Enhygromyxa salina TaxID=215803 RepID=A0A2S9YMX6_9BACT|nr:hypothetical protein [Enhygromyxa salina]PRQ06446.1 hypothetical protein ENSA7_37650 [Enhygromyxa salina]
MPRGLGLLLLLLVVFSCTSGIGYQRGPVIPATGLELGPSERAEEQRRSLRHVFYRNNEMPPTPSPRELRRLEHDLAEAPPVEVRELHDLFGNDVELLAFATRDTDADGVLDYRISEYRGKFFEGDIDLDGDGIRNVYDSAPYDRRVGGVDTNGDGVPDKPGSFADRDGDGIPDHLDWSRRKGDLLAELQTGLFRDFDVILVERSARFTPEMVHAIDDTLRLVFHERLPTLRTVAVEDQLLISPDLGDNGFMLAQTQTLTIYTKSLEGAPPLVLLGLLVHEVDHAWQLAQDFDQADLLGENKKMHFPPGNFTASLERFGWEVDENTLGEGYYHRLYWPHFYATSPRYLYRGSAANEWATWFESVERESGSEFLRDSPAVTWGMVGPYSLTSPWEWHADQLMASLYNRLDRGLSEHPNPTYRNTVGTLLRARMLQAVQAQWSRYDYRNAVGTSIDRELGRRFELAPAEIELLVERYMLPLVDLPMLSEALALESEVLGVAKLSDSLTSSWDELSARVTDPQLLRPDLHALVRASMGAWHVSDQDVEASGEEAEVDTSGDLDPEAGTDADADAEVEDGDAPPAAEPPEVEDDEPTSSQPPSARAGLTSRAGAGRVGGIMHGELQPGDDLLAGAGDAEFEDGGSGSGEGPERGSSGVRRAVDPVVSLFEQLRRAVPKAEHPASDELESVPDESAPDELP